MESRHKKKADHEEFGMEFGDVNGIKIFETLTPKQNKDCKKHKGEQTESK